MEIDAIKQYAGQDEVAIFCHLQGLPAGSVGRLGRTVATLRRWRILQGLPQAFKQDVGCVLGVARAERKKIQAFTGLFADWE